MYTTYHASPSRRPSRRTWWAAAGGLAAVLVLVALIAAACNARSDRAGELAGSSGDPPTASPGGAGAGESGSGGSQGGIGGGGNGGNDGGPENPGPENPGPESPDPESPEPEDPVQPAAEDCVSYDPANLTVEAHGDAWRLLDGSHAMKLFDTQADAEDGRTIARNWTRLCFIGRGNDRPDRSRYLVEYWQAPSGLPFGLAPDFDCVSYDPANLTVEAYGDAWRLVDGPHKMLLLDSAADAERAKLVAGGNSKLCFIGRGNDRPDRHRFITTYWRP